MSGPAPAAAPAAANAFSPLVVAGMIGVGLACFVGFVVLLAFARGPSARDGGTHAASRSAVGFAGVAQLLRDAGTPVLVSRDPSRAAAPQPDSQAATRRPAPGLMVLTPSPGSRGPAAMPDLAAATVLIVLPKWRTGDMAEHPGWVRPDGLLPDAAVLGVLPKNWTGLRLNRRMDAARPALRNLDFFDGAPAPRLPVVDRLQTLTARKWFAALSDRDGGIVLGQPQKDGPYVLADPDLLNNLALADQAGAEAAVALLSTLADGEPVAFDVSLNGLGRPRDLLRLLFVPPFLGATLCAAAAAALVGLLSVRRFGPALTAGRAFDPGKRALADNSAALIALAGREARMARPYAELTRHLAARAASAPRRLGAAELDAYLDRAAALRGLPDSFTALLAEAGRVRDRAGLVHVARRLHQWRMSLHG